MSKGEDLNMLEKITKILQSYRYDDPEKNGGCFRGIDAVQHSPFSL